MNDECKRNTSQKHLLVDAYTLYYCRIDAEQNISLSCGSTRFHLNRQPFYQILDFNILQFELSSFHVCAICILICRQRALPESWIST
jgi:hypothetical protein